MHLFAPLNVPPARKRTLLSKPLRAAHVIRRPAGQVLRMLLGCGLYAVPYAPRSRSARCSTVLSVSRLTMLLCMLLGHVSGYCQATSRYQLGHVSLRC
eukprot:1896918-Rhodomonas_salina.1